MLKAGADEAEAIRNAKASKLDKEYNITVTQCWTFVAKCRLNQNTTIGA